MEPGKAECSQIRNIALIKALKTELNHTRLRMKKLSRDRQADQCEIDDLIKQIDKDKLVRKSKKHDRLHAAVKSIRDELEDEQKLRKRSESLHRKLAQELSEVKSSLTNGMKEVERERKTRELLESLCDEFARGIKEYGLEAHALKHNSDKDWADRADHDRLILHISDTWVDERMQMQLEAAQNGLMDNKSIVDKLSLEIETFLKAKQNKRSTEKMVTRDRRSLVESVPLNDAVTSPQDVGNYDSLGSGLNCFELNKPSNRVSRVLEDEFMEANVDETIKSNLTKEKLSTRERMKNHSPSSFQVMFEEQMGWAMSCNSNKKSQSVEAEKGNATSTKPISENSKHGEANEDSGFRRKNNPNELYSSNKNQTTDNLIISQLLALDGGNVHGENEYGEASCSNAGWRNQASPARQRMSTMKPQDLDISDEFLKIPWGIKENTLKAKLLEARSKGRSHLKALKGSL